MGVLTATRIRQPAEWIAGQQVITVHADGVDLHRLPVGEKGNILPGDPRTTDKKPEGIVIIAAGPLRILFGSKNIVETNRFGVGDEVNRQTGCVIGSSAPKGRDVGVPGRAQLCRLAVALVGTGCVSHLARRQNDSPFKREIGIIGTALEISYGPVVAGKTYIGHRNTPLKDFGSQLAGISEGWSLVPEPYVGPQGAAAITGRVR